VNGKWRNKARKRFVVQVSCSCSESQFESERHQMRGIDQENEILAIHG
jgi:hypothetical protein